MLNNIRKTTDSFVIKILVAMIIFAFVGWGIKDVLQTNNNYDIVKFSHAKNISKEEFLNVKAEQIRTLQRQAGATLTEEDTKQLNLDNIIIQKLIHNRILSYLISYYQLDLSDNTIVQLIKDSPHFKNQGLFDLTLFKNFLKNSYMSEEKYLGDIKEQTLKNTIISIFLETFPIPKIMVQNIVNYMAEIREIDLVQIDLTENPKGEEIASPTEIQLEDFYKKNEDLFQLPEKRSLSYIKIAKELFAKQIHPSNDEILHYYKNNKEEFENKKFSEVQQQIEQLLQKQQIEILTTQLVKNLEDDVAAGASLIEISQKYELPIHNINYISYQEALNNPDISQNTEEIFKLAEGELSYPMSMEQEGMAARDRSSVILVEINKVQPTQIPEFFAVKNQVEKLWADQYLKDLNLKRIQNLATNYLPGQNITVPGVSVNNSAYFSRSKIQENNQFPENLLSAIFEAEINSNTSVFQSQDTAYFAHIKVIRTDKVKSQEIAEKNTNEIINAVKNSIMDELINYLIKKNNMEIRHRKEIAS